MVPLRRRKKDIGVVNGVAQHFLAIFNLNPVCTPPLLPGGACAASQTAIDYGCVRRGCQGPLPGSAAGGSPAVDLVGEIEVGEFAG